MTLLQRLVAATALAACATAQAQDLRLDASGRYTVQPAGNAGAFALQVDLPEPLTGVIAEGTESFRVQDWPVSVTLDGSAFATTGSLGWFDYPQYNYRGFDVRLNNVSTPGDLLQIIFVTADPLYTGPTASPTLERLSLVDLGGAVCYYAMGYGACNWQGDLAGGAYAVSAVPEPRALLLLPAGLALVALRLWRARRG